MFRGLFDNTVSSATVTGRIRERGLKWYFATNEQALSSAYGMYMRLAVLTARRNTTLRPHLVTTGFRNDLTEWMEAHGVTVIPGRQPLAETIRAGEAAGRYHTRYLGHWLRCEIPTLETEDSFVLYTDTDTLFLREVNLPEQLPRYLACAPEFKMEGANYFNSGVMLMNVANMRRTLPEFLRSARHQLDTLRNHMIHDQYAFNNFYRGRWTPLDPLYNWKPYWGAPDQAHILHFHGAKMDNVRALYCQRIPWNRSYWRNIGSLVASFPEGYRAAFAAVLAAIGDAELPERHWISQISDALAAGPPPVPAKFVDLSILDNSYKDLSFEGRWPLDEIVRDRLKAVGRRLRLDGAR